MKRDIIGDIFLGGVFLSLLFLFSFPAYFRYTLNAPRDIYLFERIMSVCFLLGLIMGVIWTCWKKKVWVMLGISAFGLLAYIPKWYLPKLDAKLAKPGKNIVDTLLSSFLNRIYEMVHAPFTGLIGMCSEKQAEKLPYLILPVVVIAYVLSQIVRFYRNAYIAEKKQIHDFDRFRKLNEVRSPVMPFATEPEAPSPLGTIVLNEKAEVAAESFPVKKQENDQTVMNNIAASDTQALPSGEQPTEVITLAAQAPSSRPAEETQVIALAAQAPTSRPADETQVIALAAHSPSTPIELPAQSPSTPIELPAQAPTSELPAQNLEAGAAENNLDFPDVHGEAEKIDVFGDDA